MPPGYRPPQQQNQPRVRQTAVTQAVASGDRSALDQRAQAASYNSTGQQQALRDLYGQIAQTGSGYSSHPSDTSAYALWQQSQGFRQPAQQINYGQTPEGKYAGFKNASDLKNAAFGRAELSREKDIEEAAQLKDLMQSRLGKLSTQYDDSASNAWTSSIPGAAAQGMQTAGFAQNHPQTLAHGRAGVLADAQQAMTDPYLSKLDAWYQQQAEPLVSGMETANQISQTPTREYGMRAGADYGVDPNIVAAWFPMASQVSDAANQRDIQSLNDTGMPYSEQQSTIRGVQQDTQAAQKQQAADDQLAMVNDVYGATTYPGDQLATATSLPLEVVHDLTTQPNFSGYTSAVEQAMQEAEAANPKTGNSAQDNIADNAVAAAVDDAVKQATDQVMQDSGDPNTAQALERILRALYPV